MFRLTIKNLLDKKIRFALTTIAVVVSVAMVVGVFVLTDSLRASFNGLAEDIASGAELAVRSPLEIGEEFDRPTVPESVDAVVAGVDGVARTIPGVISFNDVVIIDGEARRFAPRGHRRSASASRRCSSSSSKARNPRPLERSPPT